MYKKSELGASRLAGLMPENLNVLQKFMKKYNFKA